MKLDYQPEDEERDIVRREARCAPPDAIVAQAVALARATRNDPRVRRGASVRAAIAIADIAARLDGDVARAAALALPTRIELVDPTANTVAALVDELKKKLPSAGPS